MERPSAEVKSFSDRLARQLISPESRATLRLLRLAGLSEDQGQPSLMKGAEPAAEPESVGIWDRESRGPGSCFVRSVARFREWDLWADVGRIEPKGTARRIVLLGESAARGYLHDPLFTPAMALQGFLATAEEHWKIEVVDLARTDLGRNICAIASAAVCLSPDIVVVFAGNNWGDRNLSGPQLDVALRDEGVPGVKRLFDLQISGSARRVVCHVNAVFGAANVPVIWVIPEFNLGDWREPDSSVPLLKNEGASEWHANCELAGEALSAGVLAQAMNYAERMAQLDCGAASRAPFFLAEIALRTGNPDEARRQLELARDAIAWDPSCHVTPRSLSAVQQAIRQSANGSTVDVIDLPALFYSYLGGGIPDRRLFLDYCHLTDLGIQLAMESTARCILQKLDHPAPADSPLKQPVHPSAEVRASAAFLAAIHNAHWFQKFEIVRYHCCQALRLDPGISNLMKEYVTFQAGRTSRSLLGASRWVASSPVFQLAMQNDAPRFDATLLGAMAEALEENGFGIKPLLARIRRQVHGLAGTETDLLDPFYCHSAGQPKEGAWRTEDIEGRTLRSDFYRAYSPVSRFVLVCEPGHWLRLALTCRLWQFGPAAGLINIEMNGESYCQLTIDRRWRTCRVNITPGIAVPGTNYISVRWPALCASGDDPLNAAADDLLQGLLPAFYPVFGEIHSFTATVAEAESAGLMG